MLRDYRGAVTKVAGLALLAFVALGLFAGLSWHSTALENEATNRSEIHRQYANDRLIWVLAAQKITAWWTKVMGIAAMIGMALSTATVLLIWTTFRETKRAADAAADANSMTRQAFEESERVNHPHLEINARTYFTHDEASCRIDLVNHGPTRIEDCSWDLTATIDGTEIQNAILKAARPNVVTTIPAGRAEYGQYPLSLRPDDEIRKLDGMKMTLQVAVRYRDIRGKVAAYVVPFSTIGRITETPIEGSEPLPTAIFDLSRDRA
jgi:hypothetical protein